MVVYLPIAITKAPPFTRPSMKKAAEILRLWYWLLRKRLADVGRMPGLWPGLVLRLVFYSFTNRCVVLPASVMMFTK